MFSSVCFWKKFHFGYNFGIVHIVQTHETQTLVASLALQQIKEVGVVTGQEDISPDIECTCKLQWYMILMLSLSHLGLMIFVILCTWKLKLCRGHLFSNAVKIMLFISDEQYHVPIKWCITAGSICLFKITGTLVPENVKLNWK